MWDSHARQAQTVVGGGDRNTAAHHRLIASAILLNPCCTQEETLGDAVSMPQLVDVHLPQAGLECACQLDTGLKGDQ